MENSQDNKQYAVIADHVSKIYELRNKNNQHKSANKRFYALKDVSFKVKKGDVVGILGTNGSGKSTLSLLLSGISDIDHGTITVNGEQALIAINTGLNMQLTGLENIKVKGALMGLKKKEIEAITQDVINFSELGDFLYQPVKKYSSGMKSRLGFSISLALDPDIFIVDEALSVGDKGFAKKCIDRMMQLRDDRGKTIFFVSHSLEQVKNFCTTGMWIEGGELREMGPVDTVADHYSDYVNMLNAMKGKEKQEFLDKKFQKRLLPKQEKKGLFQKLFG
ncbi:ABC transporter ATP-binding protein [uncultured Dubosiella sp.]|uniref:ABC transporter ATP-binding protein n=1 Tax=uncultured Dubosiella sp. TaxID=1937011 RepID=UPI0020815281|nr:ABC transporter ATP-binding protein [uncultured Dubosiella sp.]GJM59372.1 teichoic acids export ABC transporter ATP-binding subunit TagH [Erysipelotrichaceae bacterium OPF54]